MIMQKKMDTENFENKMKEIIIAFESKKTENGELNRLLNSERDERKRTQIQVFSSFSHLKKSVISLRI